MKLTVWFLAAILGCATSVVAAEDAPAASEFVKPDSWEAFVAYSKQGGDFGTWKSRGKTVKIWEGIPGGLDYTLTFTISLAHDGKAILQTHFMATSTGEVISTGSILRYWDAKSKSVYSAHSGFDQGQLFTGHSTLVGIDHKNQIIKWQYTETSRGKTADYFQTVQRKGPDKRWESHQLTSGGEAWSDEVTREIGSTEGPAPGRRALQRLRGLLRRLR